MDKTKTKEAHVYLPIKVFQALQKLAKQNRRSMNAEIIVSIERRLAVITELPKHSPDKG